jgi:hypothetical protein
MADRDHEVRNVLALLRGHLELARESLATGRTDEVAPDLADALAAARRLEALLAPRPVEDHGATGS